MSVINRMLQDLDRREVGPADSTAEPRVQPVPRNAPGREWFWRTLAVLILFALAWVGWVAYQVWPRPIATELAYKTAEEANARAAPAPQAPARAEPPQPDVPSPAPAAPPPVPVAAERTDSAPAAAAATSAPASAAATSAPAAQQTFRLAKSIETPILESPRAPLARPAKPSPAKSAAIVPSRAEDAPKVERRDRLSTPAERAENEFRYAAAVLKLGRAAEAESHFAKALELDAGHRGARQALVAMRLERGELDSVQRLLEEGLERDAAQPDFAVALARIHIERQDLPAALAALDGAAAAAADAPEFQLLRGTVLQRLGRQSDAAEAYRAALRRQPALPPAWIGLGISLEALHQRREAADAFRQALAAGPVNPDVRAFAEQRIRALR